MHHGGPIHRKRARIEIVPLIDVMFFLLACFMLVSLSMISSKSLKVKLPTAQTASREAKPDTVSISVDSSGGIYKDKHPIGKNELQAELANLYTANTNTRVVISGDVDARHGSVITVLDKVRAAGIQAVAFQVEAAETAAK